MHRLAVTIALALLVCIGTHTARGQTPPITACTPVLLCPNPGGTGGRGGTGGVAANGGTGGGGAGGRAGAGGNTPAGGLVVTAGLELDRRVVVASASGTLNASVSYGNTSTKAITVREIRIAARAPGATHAGGPYADLAPVLTNAVIEPGARVTLTASRTFKPTDTVGQWEAYATHLDAAGVWHDAPSETFAVIASSGPTPPPTGSGMSVGTQAWFIAPWAGTSYFKSGVAWATAYAAGDDIWNPQLIADLQGFSVWRHMDMNAVNFSKIKTWSQRKLPTDPGNAEIYIDGASPASTTGLAIEWQIDLSNRANVDCWFTHPYLADDNYITQQATLIKAKLSPALRAYVELSNEVWNGSFSAFQQSIDAGKALGVPGSNQYYQGIAHEMVRALQLYQIYQTVFGAAAMGDRVIRVFAESGNLDLTTQALRNVYASAQWNPHGQKIDMIALAPYIGNGVNGASETLTRWKSEVDSKVNGEPIAVAVEQGRTHNIPLLGCYEAGMHHLTNADQWARNADAYDAYVYMLDRFAEKMNGPCSLYTLHGTWEGKGAWGLYNNVGQATSSAPKARGTKEWIAGTAVRATSTTRIIVIVVIVLFVFVLALAIGVWLRWRWHTLRPTTPPGPPPSAD
jgi:hypothetical protein